MESISETALSLSDIEKLELIRLLVVSMVNSELSSDLMILFEDFQNSRSELTFDQVWGR